MPVKRCYVFKKMERAYHEGTLLQSENSPSTSSSFVVAIILTMTAVAVLFPNAKYLH